MIVSSDFEACQLEITSNGSIDIQSDVNVIVNHKIINYNSAEQFNVASGANLIQNEHVSNQGEITVNQISQPIKRLDYTLWSTPVYNQEIQAFSPETLPNRIYTYEGESGYIVVQNPNENFINGKGYLFRAPNTWSSTQTSPYNAIFKGTPFNQELTFELYENSYTSVGNPYPSNIDADRIFDLNPNLSAFYFWTNENSPDENGSYTSNNYATYNRTGGTSATGTGITPNGIISTGQGFIVKSTGNSLVIDNSTRSILNATFIRAESSDKHRFWLDLYNENNNFNQILIGYIEGATQEIDPQFDAEMFKYEGNSIYTLIDNKKFTIQSKGLNFQETDIVPMGFNAVESGTYRISLTQFDGLFGEENIKIYIKDNDLNLYHNLFEADYVFNSQIGEFNDRFEIVYQVEDEMGISDISAESLEIYTQGKLIHVKAKDENLASVQLFDLQGRILHNENDLKSNVFSVLSPNVNSSVIIVKVTLADGKIKTKKVLVK